MARIHHDKNDPYKKFNSLHKKLESGCWEWQGYIMKNGYAQQRFGGKKVLVHRFSWELHNNKIIPDGMVACHKCDNKKCVNPSHIFIGTQNDNVQDCIKKNRHAKGYDKGKTLKKNDVLKIRSLYKTGKYKQKDLAEKFGVSRTNITLIVNNKRWSHI